MIHPKKSMLAGKAVRIQEHIQHPFIEHFGGAEIRIEDWWDRVENLGKRWKDCLEHPACADYNRRLKIGIPDDDQVLYGIVRNKLGGTAVLVHIREIQI